MWENSPQLFTKKQIKIACHFYVHKEERAKQFFAGLYLQQVDDNFSPFL